MRSTAEQLSVNTSIAVSGQATAKLLADAISSGLAQRRTAEQAGIDTNVDANVSAKLQAPPKARKMLYRLDSNNMVLQKNLVLIQVLYGLMNIKFFKFNCSICFLIAECLQELYFIFFVQRVTKTIAKMH